MRLRNISFAIAPTLLVVGSFLLQSQEEPNQQELWQHRNLGKAFYENPTTASRAVEEFKKALDLAPQSARERVNYGLALLQVGRMDEGIEQLKRVQQQDPSIPHPWFNLGIVYKNQGQHELAIKQFEKMVELVAEDPISHYNLGVLYKLTGEPDRALTQFETAARLDPTLAGPRFQLYNAYRFEGRTQEAERELKIFQELKESQKGAAVPEDLEWSFYSEIYDEVDPAQALNGTAPEVDLQFETLDLAGDYDVYGSGLLVMDANGDGITDLLAWSADQIRLYESGKNPTATSGLQNSGKVFSIAAGDYDNDGLADLCLITESGAVLYRNDKGSFERQSMSLPSGNFSKALWVDFDHDYDLDLLLIGEDSALARNNGSSGFSDITADFPFLKGRATDAVLLDLIKDVNGVDIVVSYSDRSGVIYRDRLGGRYEAVPVDELKPGLESMRARDFDNDGWTDLAASFGPDVLLLRNQDGRFELLDSPQIEGGPPVWADLQNSGFPDLISGSAIYVNEGLARFSEAGAFELRIIASAAADFDQDGRMDVAALNEKGKLKILLNRTQSGNQWIHVALTGVKNLKLAPGAEVEVKTGALYQKQIYDGHTLLFGLQDHEQVEAVRITWRNGLIQNEIQQPTGTTLSYTEKPRLSGSCPMIFTWNGEEFEFITDVLGVAPLGAGAGDGEYFPVDHDEYIQIPAESLAPANGFYEVRITEELREVSYLDQIQLIAVDHPAELDVFTNDKFKAPPFPEFRLFGVSERIYPSAVRDHRGRDMRDRVLKRDRTYADGFTRDYSGIAEMHHLELDFGKASAPENRAVLVLSGWVDWADGSTFIQSSQEESGGLILPCLQVMDERGKWRTVIEDMGIPAGKPKTIVVDLAGRFISDSRKVRIVTNLCVYWDEIFLSEQTEEPPLHLTKTVPHAAQLQFRGFSRPVIHSERKQPEAFDYSEVSPISMWNPTPGLYTRYGQVQELLEFIDDRLVIMGSGDELRLLFRAAQMPDLKPGYKRDFLLFVDGWAKDGDLNTAFSQTVEPLPFHGMSAYPYSENEAFPSDTEHRLYKEYYNIRPALRLLRPLQ